MSLGQEPSLAERLTCSRLAPVVSVVVFDAPFALLLLGERDVASQNCSLDGSKSSSSPNLAYAIATSSHARANAEQTVPKYWPKVPRCSGGFVADLRLIFNCFHARHRSRRDDAAVRPADFRAVTDCE